VICSRDGGQYGLLDIGPTMNDLLEAESITDCP